DHSMIFVFIAGTYTPVLGPALDAHHGDRDPVGALGGAVLGVAMSLITPDAPAWVAAPLDVALGWVATFVLPELAHIGGLTALAQLLASGALSGRRGLLRNAMAKPLA